MEVKNECVKSFLCIIRSDNGAEDIEESVVRVRVWSGGNVAFSSWTFIATLLFVHLSIFFSFFFACNKGGNFSSKRDEYFVVFQREKKKKKLKLRTLWLKTTPRFFYVGILWFRHVLRHVVHVAKIIISVSFLFFLLLRKTPDVEWGIIHYFSCIPRKTALVLLFTEKKKILLYFGGCIYSLYIEIYEKVINKN